MSKRSTAAKGISNELLAQAKFAKDPNLVVFTPVGNKGPVDIVTLDLTTGVYTAYDVKTQNYRKSYYRNIKFSNGYKPGQKIYRGRTDEQKRLGVKIFNFDPNKDL